MQKWLKIVAPVLAAAVLFGCGGAKTTDTPKQETAPAAQTTQTTPAPAPKPELVPGSKGEMILATTTSTQDSGLLDVIIPIFEKQTGYKVKVVAVGSGAALAMGEKGEADAILAHAPASEQKLVDAHTVTNYKQIMHNDFVIVGPAADPAKVKGTDSLTALKAIAAAKAPFVTRGDNSGTDQLEKGLWKQVSITPDAAWYINAGTGMAKTLSLASEKNGYTITDRATYLAQQKNLALEILVQGDKPLLNIYHVMQVNSAKFEKVNAAAGEAFVNFMVNADTQKVISEFGKDKYGQALFFSDVK